ncbi:tubulin-specific chaperone D-like [Saccoglossus kowalevskii]|uniref:Tubulin-specific chaperone D n=1 Tax=Saccoglossus kowalevskii TaxID=10224 RepID=A0ABM0LWD8_SACKO|nr:PREDICTED: tubulin-specific chaperone D-like [Saccoglossus kowalevskii]
MAVDASDLQDIGSDGHDIVGKGSILDAFEEADEVKELIKSLKNIYTDQISVEIAVERFTVIVDNYQEQPHLLDPHLQCFLDELLALARDSDTPPALSHLAFKCMYLLTKSYLDVSDKSRDAAAYCLSKFLTRPDVKKEKLPAFLDWCLTVMTKADRETMPGMTVLSGVLSTLALLFKHGKREDLVSYAPVVLDRLSALTVTTTNNTILRKQNIKLIQRLGLTFVKARIATWRYQRGSRSLLDNLKKTQQSPADVSTVTQGDEDYDIPEEIEEVIDQLLIGLKDKDTVVRWSAAKGVGRITGRLPQELADQVVESVLELFSLSETDGAWHGGCLALAELGRRGLLLPERLPEVVPVVIKALGYDEKRGSYSVGAHVRDAACYVCWSFARAYEPDVLQSHVNDIANALIIATVFDREVNCRRAASAAFQENVGRQGTFPYGIDILTTADYFAVGNRTNTYLNISVYVAQYPEYTVALIDHLVKVKLNHWDGVIRELASKALHNLTPKAPEYMAKTVVPFLIPFATGIDLNYRHGSVFALAEITHALYNIALDNNKTVMDFLDKSSIEGLKNITVKMHEAKMFRGLSGEIMRPAVCKFIGKLSLSKLPYHDDSVTELWQTLLDDNIQFGHQFADQRIQDNALSALPSLCNEYYRQNNGLVKPGIQDKVISKYLSELKSKEETSKMGFALALGSLPKFMVAGKFTEVMSGLVQATHINQQDAAKMVEARRDAVKALTCLCTTMGVDSNGSPNHIICKDNILSLYEAYFLAMNDYTLDSRGDVGTWVREASMTGLYELTTMTVKADPNLISEHICKKVFCCLIQQSAEKIDRTRSHAGEILLRMLYFDDPPIPNVLHRDKLMTIFPRSDLKELNWGASSDTFPKITQALSCPTYRYSLLLGLTVSVGGLTESLVKHSSQSLLTYLRSLSNNQESMTTFADTVVMVFEEYQKVDRVSIPMLKMLDILLTNGCFEIFTQREEHFLPVKLLELCKKEIEKSGDPQKLLASIDVFCGLIVFSGVVRAKSLSQLMLFLCHKYPKVRKTTANKLYESLLTYDEIVDPEKLDDVLTILSETQWDEPVRDIRPIRNNLCDLMEIKKPIIKAGTKAKKTETKDEDEMASYKDLVTRLGY